MGANADALRKVYAAFGAGDVPAVLGAMDEKIEWQEPTGLPFENQVGPQAVAENIFGPVTTQLEGFSVTPEEIIDGGDTVAAIGRYGGKGAASGIVLDAEFVHIWRFGPDGKITGFRTYTDTHLWRQALGVD
ncbi:MAG: nuclear transport factor 2 family protein [Actinomycetota bacterium]